LVGDDGLLEIKCPNTVTQIKRVLANKPPAEYMAQIQGQMWVSGRKWCDFVSFDPRINTDADYFCIRIERDEKYIETLESKCKIFVEDLKALIEKLSK